MLNENGNLVDIAEKFPHLHIDMKYATADNITGRAIYSKALCLLHSDAVPSLEKSIDIARMAGLRLCILDAYRPQKAQERLWQACPDSNYVIPPTAGSHHTRGVAVDVTLMDTSGTRLDMGTDFDDMRVLSHTFHPQADMTHMKNRLLLNAIMLKGGFRGVPTEWWHFELPGAGDYPLIENAFPCI